MSETQNIEYKSSWCDEFSGKREQWANLFARCRVQRKITCNVILRWTCGFANAQDGTLYMGKDDNGNVAGMDDAKKLMEDVPNKITAIRFCNISPVTKMKKRSLLLLFIFIMMTEQVCSQENLPFFDLTSAESAVISRKGTEKPFTGKYYDFSEKGTYLCKRCGNALYHSSDKFNSSCGWPSFDDEVKGAVRRLPDPDGIRIEIECASCGAHLGHVFTGEGFTLKKVRHCVNSLSIDFEPVILAPGRYGIALFAGGCFWGVEYHLQQIEGVESVTSGFTGGHVFVSSNKFTTFAFTK